MTQTLALAHRRAGDVLEKSALAEVAVAALSAERLIPRRWSTWRSPGRELAIARALVRSARAREVAMTGPGGDVEGVDQDGD